MFFSFRSSLFTDLSYNLHSVIFLRIPRTQCGWNYTVHGPINLVPITDDLHLNYLYPPLFSLFHFLFHHSIYRIVVHNLNAEII